tara:strand:+ start:1274 stop:1777 length:504 start_codon:yes stop_codon:yes gene_type:complete
MKTLNKKISISKDNVTNRVDFAEPTYVPNYNSEHFLVKRIVEVSEEYDRRVDLISLAVYNSDQYSDIILKCNEISDPLSIRTGDYILIPELNSAKNFYRNPNKESKESKQKYIDSTKKSKSDTKRLETLAKISSSVKNGSKVNVKPNELKPGESNIETNKETNSFSV